MRLYEILEKPSSKIATSTKSAHDLFTNTDALTFQGSGGQAIAYLHKKFPRKIVKTVQITGVDDPVYQFLRLALNHQDNPYFPKIYSVKMYVAKKQDYNDRKHEYALVNVGGKWMPSIDNNVLYVVMERLYPITNPRRADLVKLGIDVDTLPDRGVVKALEYAFSYGVSRQQMYAKATDVNFKKALRLLEPLFQHYSSDMHSDNMMMRTNKQWVFIDPITY